MLVAKKGRSALEIHRTIYGDPVHGRLSHDLVHVHSPAGRDAQQGMGLRSWAKSRLTRPTSAAKTAIGTGSKRARSSAKPKAAQPLGDAVGYGKIGVIGAIERKGNVVCKVIGDASAETLGRFVRTAVSEKVALSRDRRKSSLRLRARWDAARKGQAQRGRVRARQRPHEQHSSELLEPVEARRCWELSTRSVAACFQRTASAEWLRTNGDASALCYRFPLGTRRMAPRSKRWRSASLYSKRCSTAPRRREAHCLRRKSSSAERPDGAAHGGARAGPMAVSLSYTGRGELHGRSRRLASKQGLATALEGHAQKRVGSRSQNLHSTVRIRSPPPTFFPKNAYWTVIWPRCAAGSTVRSATHDARHIKRVDKRLP